MKRSAWLLKAIMVSTLAEAASFAFTCLLFSFFQGRAIPSPGKVLMDRTLVLGWQTEIAKAFLPCAASLVVSLWLGRSSRAVWRVVICTANPLTYLMALAVFYVMHPFLPSVLQVLDFADPVVYGCVLVSCALGAYFGAHSKSGNEGRRVHA